MRLSCSTITIKSAFASEQPSKSTLTSCFYYYALDLNYPARHALLLILNLECEDANAEWLAGLTTFAGSTEVSYLPTAGFPLLRNYVTANRTTGFYANDKVV